MLLTILVVVLLLAALGALPTWPHSRSWGYYPSGGLCGFSRSFTQGFSQSFTHPWVLLLGF